MSANEIGYHQGMLGRSSHRPARPFSPYQCRPAAFTLIELLVVVSIIALLISILLPSLGKAREVARTTVCMTQQRQITASMIMFSGDYRGWAPGNDYNTGRGMGQAVYADGSQRNSSILLATGRLPDYELFLCPSSELDRAPGSWLYRHGWNYQYRYNIHYGGIKNAPHYASENPTFASYEYIGAHKLGTNHVLAAKIRNARHPLYSVLMTDGVHFADYHDHAAPVDPSGGIAETWLAVTAAHVGHTVVNASYIDGHTESAPVFQKTGSPPPTEPWWYGAFPTYYDPYIDID